MVAGIAKDPGGLWNAMVSHSVQIRMKLKIHYFRDAVSSFV